MFGSLISRRFRSRNYSTIDLTFDSAVSMKESFFAPLSMTELFSQLGGALGLWLGLGVMQIVEKASNFEEIISAVLKNIKQKN